MKHLLLILLFTPILLFAQENEKYLVGAVPEVNGKVIFSKEVMAPALSKDQIYDILLAWANGEFNDDKNRVVYSNKEKGEIAVTAEDYLVFSSTALSLDRSLMSYRMIFQCQDQSCKISVTAIRYEYDVSYQREPERYTAEEWITDGKALNKGKLIRLNSKFRTATIDYVSDLLNNAALSLNVTPAIAVKTPDTPMADVKHDEVITSAAALTPATAVTPSIPVTAATTTSNSLQGYRQITPDKIPGNIIKMLSEDWMLITAGNDSEFNMMTASWGGLGFVFGKPVAFCFINPTRYTYQLMEKYDTYTLTFYTEAYREALEYCGNNSGKDTDKVKGAGLTPVTTPEGSKAFGEAWMIIECRKLISQSLSTESISNENVRREWLGKQVNKLYAGEIINVWIK